MKQYYLYILANRPGGALYVGVTNDLVRRVYEHKHGLIKGHSSRYKIDKLVHFEALAACIENADNRRKQSFVA